VLVAVALSLPSDVDPTDPDVGSNYSPTNPSGTVLKKKKLKKLLFLG
jgi:aspartate/methionine/tyrosine aminotransferase